jgi:hypothetical protein
MRRANAQNGESTIWTKKLGGKFAAALLLSTSILPQAAHAQSTTVGASDVDGPDDEQNQSDLTSFEIFCPASLQPVFQLLVQLDPAADSDNPQSKVSIRFDTDGDGNENYSYLATLNNDPFTVVDILLLQSSDEGSQNSVSGGASEVQIGTTKAAANIVADPQNRNDRKLVSFDLDLDAIAEHAGVIRSDIQFLNVATILASSVTTDQREFRLASQRQSDPDDGISKECPTQTSITATVAAEERQQGSAAAQARLQASAASAPRIHDMNTNDGGDTAPLDLNP